VVESETAVSSPYHRQPFRRSIADAGAVPATSTKKDLQEVNCMLFTEKEIKFVKNLDRILGKIQKGFITALNRFNHKISLLEARVSSFETERNDWIKELNAKRITERIYVGNEKDFIYELAKRVERLEDKMD
jgi:translation elongation factor EF-G